MSAKQSSTLIHSVDSVDTKKIKLDDSEITKTTKPELSFLDVMRSKQESKQEMETEKYKNFFDRDNKGFYHNLHEINEISTLEEKKIKKILLNINVHAGVSQIIHAELDLLDDSSDNEIEHSEDTDNNVITTILKQNQHPVLTIVTETCTIDHPITLINFPCGLDTPVIRLDYTRSEIIGYPIQELGYNSCVNSQFLNRLLSYSTYENLDETLSLVVDETNVRFQQLFSSVNSGVGQMPVKKELQTFLKKHFEVSSDDNTCHTIDLYIYDMVGTHKYTIMASPPRIRFMGSENSNVIASFNELQKYYKDHENIKGLFQRLRQSFIVTWGEKVKCTIETQTLVNFINELKTIDCDIETYIIDGSCFNARTINYDMEGLPREKKNHIEKALAFVMEKPPYRQLYGGKYKIKRTKRKGTKRKRVKYSKKRFKNKILTNKFKTCNIKRCK